MKKYLYLIFILGIFLVPIKVLAESEEVTLSRCVDGDTARFNINGKVYSTRFLAIDTPETVKPNTKVQPWGKEASNYTCSQLKKASKIVLEYDSNSTKEDKYGRRLAWVFVDDKLLEDELVSKGYAKVAYLYGNYKYTDLIKKKEQIAKNQKIGIWSNSSPSSNDDIKLLKNEILKKLYKYIRKELKSML